MQGNLGREQGSAHPLSLAGTRALVEGCQDAVGGEPAAGHGADGQPQAYRWPARLAGEAHATTHRLDHQVVARTRRGGALVTEGSEAAADDVRLDLPQPLVVGAEPPQRLGTVVVD